MLLLRLIFFWFRIVALLSFRRGFVLTSVLLDKWYCIYIFVCSIWQKATSLWLKAWVESPFDGLFNRENLLTARHRHLYCFLLKKQSYNNDTKIQPIRLYFTIFFFPPFHVLSCFFFLFFFFTCFFAFTSIDSQDLIVFQSVSSASFHFQLGLLTETPHYLPTANT